MNHATVLTEIGFRFLHAKYSQRTAAPHSAYRFSVSLNRFLEEFTADRISWFLRHVLVSVQ